MIQHFSLKKRHTEVVLVFAKENEVQWDNLALLIRGYNEACIIKYCLRSSCKRANLL